MYLLYVYLYNEIKSKSFDNAKAHPPYRNITVIKTLIRSYITY